MQARPIVRDKQRLEELVDPKLVDQYPKEQFYLAAAIAAACVAPEPSQRPSMGEVLQFLKMLLQQRWENAFLFGKVWFFFHSPELKEKIAKTNFIQPVVAMEPASVSKQKMKFSYAWSISTVIFSESFILNAQKFSAGWEAPSISFHVEHIQNWIEEHR